MMQSWEMEKKSREGVSKKLSMYHSTEQKKEASTPNKYASYAQAKEAGDTQAMIGFRLANMSSRRAGLMALSNEYSKLSITEIQNRIKSSGELLEKASEIKNRMYKQEYDRLKREYAKIGGLVGERLEGEVISALEDYARRDADYKEAVAEYNNLSIEVRALKNAKEIWINDNKALIEEERIKAQRADLLSSGVLQELGIAKQEG